MLKEVENWHIHAIRTDVKFRGPRHSDVAAYLFNYAKTLIQSNRIEEAMERLKESREIEYENKNEENVDEIDLLMKQYM